MSWHGRLARQITVFANSVVAVTARIPQYLWHLDKNLESIGMHPDSRRYRFLMQDHR
jgi:hypothetical protein